MRTIRTSGGLHRGPAFVGILALAAFLTVWAAGPSVAAQERKPEGVRETVGEASEPGYPRPQMRRASWTPLNGEWEFAIDAAAEARAPGEVNFNRRITVPFAPETPASGVGDTSYFSACWYRRTATIEAPGAEERILLHCEAVDETSDVWVNGVWCGKREGGYTRQTWDITDALGGRTEHEIILRVFDDPQDMHKPRGKQDWMPQPHGIWYPRTTGIWQTVWMERVPGSRISTLRWTSSLERFEIGITALIDNPPPADGALRVRLKLGTEVLAEEVISPVVGRVQMALRIPDPGIEDARRRFLWSPEHPVLLDAEVELLGPEGKLLDRVESYTALRTIAVNGGRLELNGLPYYLRFALDQGYWPETGMTAPGDAALAEDIRLAKAMGFNGVRKHQKIEAERYLYWADKIGFLVWEELPSAYAFSPEAVRKLTGVWEAAIGRDLSHPCIVAWVPFNESWAVPDLPASSAQRSAVAALHHLAKALDGTRPVLGNDGWEITETDLVGIHDYEADPSALAARINPTGRSWQEVLAPYTCGGRRLLLDGKYGGQPVLLTEFGGIKLDPGGSSWGYSTAANADDLAGRYGRLLRAVRSIPGLGGFCYTQLTDAYQEANGLLTMKRVPKVPLKVLSIATRGPGNPEEAEMEKRMLR